MRVLFLLAPQRVRNTPAVRDQPTIEIPMGVLHIAASVRAKGLPVTMEVYDARMSTRRRRLADGSTWFGDAPAEIEARIRSARPDVVAISNMFSWQVEQAFEVASIAKRARPGVITVLGGPHASSFPTECIERQDIDYVVMGEGEHRFTALLEALMAGGEVSIQGVLGRPEDASLLRANKKVPIRFIDPLDSLPLPAYDLVDMEGYFTLMRRGYAPRNRSGGRREVSIMTSRGCPHQCVFCSIQTTMGYRYRPHSPEYVGEHLRYLTAAFGVDYVHFEDDNFTHDGERYDRILDQILALEQPPRWDTPNGIRGDGWTRDRVRRTKAAGCQFLIAAIESGVQRVVTEVVKKRLDLASVDHLMRACKAEGLRLYAYYVMGLPGETLADLQATVDYALDRYERFNVFPTFNLAIPLPGTELHDTVLAQGLHRGPLSYGANEIHTESFDPVAVSRLHKQAIRRVALVSVRKAISSPSHARYFLSLALRYRHQIGTYVRGRWNTEQPSA